MLAPPPVPEHFPARQLCPGERAAMWAGAGDQAHRPPAGGILDVAMKWLVQNRSGCPCILTDLSGTYWCLFQVRGTVFRENY